MNRLQRIIIIVIIMVAIVAGFLGYMFITDSQVYAKTIEGFSTCLGSKNATMYGAYWCSHCQNQKSLFGPSFKNINYVECTENEERCRVEGVAGFPTWKVDGRLLVGEQSLQQLSVASGCEWSG
jgi:hypothetical protein